MTFWNHHAWLSLSNYDIIQYHNTIFNTSSTLRNHILTSYICNMYLMTTEHEMQHLNVIIKLLNLKSLTVSHNLAPNSLTVVATKC